jgi:folate-dependent phosphoribosylglycinamide formyltransferase PurN
MALARRGGRAVKARIPQIRTAKQQRALSREIDRQLAEHMREFEADYIALALYAAHIEFGFGKARLDRLKHRMYELNRALIEHYEMPHESMYIARQKLLEMGIDTAAGEQRMIDFGFKK